jgi:hypothetical protein
MTQVISVTARRETHVEKLVLYWTAVASLPAILDLSRENSALALASLVVAPVAVFWYAKRQLFVADLIIFLVFGVAWLAAVTLPVLFPNLYKDRMWHELSPGSLDLAALWMYRCWAAFCLAYWGARLWFAEDTGREASWFDLRVQVLMRRWIGVLAILGTVSYIVLTGGHTFTEIIEGAKVEPTTLMQISLLFYELSYAYVFIYFYTRSRAKLGRIDTYLLYALLVVQAVVFVGSGSKYSIMSLLVAWAVGYTTGFKRPGFLRGLSVAATGACVVFAASYLVATYRGELVWRRLPSREAPVTDVLAFQFDVITTAVSGVLFEGRKVGEGYYATDYDNATVRDRFAYLSAFAQVLEMLDGKSPYEDAYTSLITPVFAFIPRDLFPDKVHFYDPADFAELNGWTYGGLGITIPGSFFWAWGYFGIISGMAAAGLCFAWMWSRGTGAQSNAFIVRCTMIIAVIHFADIGTTFQMIVVPVTRVFALLLLLRWGIRIWLRTARLA